MKLFSFTVSAAKPWLMLPVDNSGKKVDVIISCGDTVIKTFDMKLANGKAADWFTPIPVGAFSGKTLRFAAEREAERGGEHADRNADIH